jgi:NitT/TauT family transport system substrate-binding protein
MFHFHRLGAAVSLTLLFVLVAAMVGIPSHTPGAEPPHLSSVTTAAAAPLGQLLTTPVVDVKVGAILNAAAAPHLIALERGYFRDVGLNVEIIPLSNGAELLPALAQGQIQVGFCASSIVCLNALGRGADVQYVADYQSAGQTERTRGSTALVVRKDLWDAGTIRTAADVVGRTIHTPAGARGAGPWLDITLWLQRQGLDLNSVELTTLPFPDQLAAMQNRGIELGYQSEPFLSAGLARGAHEVLATIEEMHPGAQLLTLMYWAGIDRMGPLVGERFMVAYLRGARDYLNAFEYGIEQEVIIDILVKHTPLKDPAVHRQSRHHWIDPNGALNRAALEGDVAFLVQQGVLPAPIDLAPALVDRYRQFAVQYLGEYQPPR